MEEEEEEEENKKRRLWEKQKNFNRKMRRRRWNEKIWTEIWKRETSKTRRETEKKQSLFLLKQRQMIQLGGVGEGIIYRLNTPFKIFPKMPLLPLDSGDKNGSLTWSPSLPFISKSLFFFFFLKLGFYKFKFLDVNNTNQKKKKKGLALGMFCLLLSWSLK